MDAKRKKKLEAAGWKVDDATDFLSLSSEEAEFIELKLALAQGLREERTAQGADPGAACTPCRIQSVSCRQDGIRGPIGQRGPHGAFAVQARGTPQGRS
jgi:hypothetical protein